MSHVRQSLPLFLLLLAASASKPVFAEMVTRSADFDRWMYPFNSSPGTRSNAPVFGAVGETSFDDFDGQFLVGFNTAAAGIPTSLPPGKHLKLTSVKVTATHSTGSFVYDPTFDPYGSYLSSSDPNFVADADAGRPIELWGAGLRGGYTAFGFGPMNPGDTIFQEGDFFAFADPTLPKVRNAFAYDPLLGDMSNPVSDGLFSAVPWAVGSASTLAPGSLVEQGIPGKAPGTTFTFEIDLSRPEVLNYLTTGLQQGQLFFTIVSLHATSQSGGSNPNFYTRDNFDPAALPPSLSIEYEIVPEPASLVLLAGGLAAAGMAHGWRIGRARKRA
jgi:hypothetical protein